MKNKIEMFKRGLINKEKLLESLQGWNAYASWANTFKLRKKLIDGLKARNIPKGDIIRADEMAIFY